MFEHKFTKVAAAGLVACVLLPLAATMPASTTAAATQNACSEAADSARESCRSEALSEFWLQRAKCVNLPTPSERVQCTLEALAHLDEDRDDCDAQHEARLDLCADLGGGNYAPTIDPADFVTVVDNPRFPLVPGAHYVYERHVGTSVQRTDVRVSNRIKHILGVACLTVEDIASEDGQVVERTFDWFAQDVHGNVWYFGEYTVELEDGLVVSLDGAWEAGVDGALPGIIMQAAPQVGDVYRLEYLVGEAEDAAGVLSLSAPVTVPFGSFPNCLQTEDFTPLEPDAMENKFYAPGIGLVLEVNAVTGARNELVSLTYH